MPVPAYFSPAMQSLKYLEDFILIFRLETYTVIGYTKMKISIVCRRLSSRLIKVLIL